MYQGGEGLKRADEAQDEEQSCALFKLDPKCQSLFDSLHLLACKFPFNSVGHFSRFLLTANANDRPCENRLPEDPGDCQVSQLFVVILGNGLERISHLFEPGIVWLLGIAVSPPKIILVEKVKLEAIC